MTSRFQHPSYSSKIDGPQRLMPAERPARPVWPGIDVRVLIQADRSCCCTARPAVAAMMPPSASRDHATELLLCMHHYRASERALAAAGATVIDRQGRVLRVPVPEPDEADPIRQPVASR